MRSFFERKYNKRGALTLEYVILATAMTSSSFLFFHPSGIFQRALSCSYETVSNSMVEMGARLDTTHLSIGADSDRRTAIAVRMDH